MAYTPLNGGVAFVTGQPWAYQDANDARLDLADHETRILAESAKSAALANAIIGHQLGGRRTTGIVSSSAGSWSDVPEWLDVVLDGTNCTGLTKIARVQRKTGSTGVSVTARVWNVTDSSAAGTGTAHSSDTNWKEETFVITVKSAVKTYRLQLSGGTTSGEVFGVGKIEFYTTSS